MPKPFSQISGDLKTPLLGDTIGFLTRPIELFDEKQRLYGNIYRVRLFGNTGVHLVGAEANRFLLVEQAKYFSSKQGWEFPIGKLFHGGLMLRDGDDHKHHRGLLQAAFKKEPMSQYLHVMSPMIQEQIRGWERNAEVRVFPAVKALTLALAGKVFFNLDFSNDLQRINQAIIDIVKASTTAIPFNWPFTQYRRGMKGRKLLQEYFGGVVRQRRQQPAGDMLSHLCLAKDEDGNQLSDQEIIDHLIFFIMAAHDTTASTLTSLFYELAVHPDWQEKLREESIKFSQEHTLDAPNLAKLEQLEWVMQETLRLHPPLILIPRRATKTLEYEGYVIPEGTNVTVLLYHNHLNKQYWTNPEQFDPLRFSASRMEHRKCPHAYAPFGAGQHFCLGHAFADMQVKSVMHHMLLTYRCKLPSPYQVNYNPIPIQHPRDGLRMLLYKLEPVSA